MSDLRVSEKSDCVADKFVSVWSRHSRKEGGNPNHTLGVLCEPGFAGSSKFAKQLTGTLSRQNVPAHLLQSCFSRPILRALYAPSFVYPFFFSSNSAPASLLATYRHQVQFNSPTLLSTGKAGVSGSVLQEEIPSHTLRSCEKRICRAILA